MSARDEVLARVRRAKGGGPGAVPREYRAAGSRGPGDLELFAERLRDYRAGVRFVPADQVAEAIAAALHERGARRVVAAPGTPAEWTELSYPAGRVEFRDPLGGDLREAVPGEDRHEAALTSDGSQAAPDADSREAPPGGHRHEAAPDADRSPAMPGGDGSAATPAEHRGEAIRTPVDVATLERADAVLTACHVAIAETGTIVLDHDAADQGPRALTLVPDYHLVVVRADQVVAGVPDAVAALAGVRTQTWISGPSATSDIELERVEGVHGPRTLEVVIVVPSSGRG